MERLPLYSFLPRPLYVINGEKLFPDVQVSDDFAVARNIFTLQVSEQAPSLAHNVDERTLRGNIFRSRLQMFGEVIYFLCEQSNLCLGRAGVFFRLAVFFDNLFFNVLC